MLAGFIRKNLLCELRTHSPYKVRVLLGGGINDRISPSFQKGVQLLEAFAAPTQQATRSARDTGDLTATGSGLLATFTDAGVMYQRQAGQDSHGNPCLIDGESTAPDRISSDVNTDADTHGGHAV